MVTWQRRISVGSRRLISVTALGRSSLSSFPFLPGRPLFLLAGQRSWFIRIGAIPNFALTEFSEVRSMGGSTLGSPTRPAGLGYGIRVSMHKLPLIVFGSKDHRSP